MYFQPDKVYIFRSATTRSNVRYTVQIIPSQMQPDDEEDLVVAKVDTAVHQYPTGKVVVYANSINKVNRLAERLHCDAYFHHTDNKSQKFHNFRSGKRRIIVATSALGLGVDIPDIRLIIH